MRTSQRIKIENFHVTNKINRVNISGLNNDGVNVSGLDDDEFFLVVKFKLFYRHT